MSNKKEYKKTFIKNSIFPNGVVEEDVINKLPEEEKNKLIEKLFISLSTIDKIEIINSIP